MSNFLKKLKENKFVTNNVTFEDERFQENLKNALKQSRFDR